MNHAWVHPPPFRYTSILSARGGKHPRKIWWAPCYERFFGPKNSVGEWRDLEAEIHYLALYMFKTPVFCFREMIFHRRVSWRDSIHWMIFHVYSTADQKDSVIWIFSFPLLQLLTVGSLSRIIVFKIKLLVELDSWSQILPGKVWGKNKSYMALNQPEIQKVIMFLFHQWNLRRADLWSLGVVLYDPWLTTRWHSLWYREMRVIPKYKGLLAKETSSCKCRFCLKVLLFLWQSFPLLY